MWKWNYDYEVYVARFYKKNLWSNNYLKIKIKMPTN